MIPIIFQVTCCILVWLSLYSGFWCWNKHRSQEWSCRVVTFLHGLIVTFLSGYIVLTDGPWPLTRLGQPNSPLQVFLISLSLGYFIFDFSWCLLFNSEGDLILCHHLLSLCGLTLVLDTGRSAGEISAVIFVSEVTNPLLQLRWFLRDGGGYPSFAGDMIEVLFVTLFLGLRIIGGAWILCSVMNSPETMVTLKGGILAMYVVSLVFMWDVFRFAKKKMVKKYHVQRNEGVREELPESNRLISVC